MACCDETSTVLPRRRSFTLCLVIPLGNLDLVHALRPVHGHIALRNAP
jgi:hypothetical protein